jgi:zinc/manganese transport system permease protein
MTSTAIDWHILLPALLAGLLVLATHVPLGAQVLQRGIVFIDLAIAQIAGVGVIAADAMGFEPQGWAVQAAALSAALLGALALTWTERRWPDIQEALIGVLFVLASCAGLLLLAGNPHGGEHLKDLLVGQILWVSTQQLIGMAALTVLVLALWFGLRERLGRAGFYLLFALAVTASVQLVGVYLVFTSLIHGLKRRLEGRPIFRVFLAPSQRRMVTASYLFRTSPVDSRTLWVRHAKASGGQEKRLQIAQEVETPLGRSHVMKSR